MTVGEQLSIFDMLEAPTQAPAVEWSPPEIDGECEHCGTPISSRNPIHLVNHGHIDDTCTSRWLSRNHALRSMRQLDPEQRKSDEVCFQHPTRKKACPQKCFESEYERHAARAKEAWGGDAWKEHEK